MQEAQLEIAMLDSQWMKAQGIAQYLQKQGVDVVNLDSIADLDAMCNPDRQLLLVIPAHTDDAEGGYRHVRRARSVYDREAVRIALLTDALGEVLRIWINKQGADLAFALPEQKTEFYRYVSAHFSGNDSPLKQEFTSDLLDKLTQLLSGYVGPIADVFVSDAAVVADSEEQLCRLLSEAIDDGPGKVAFLIEVLDKQITNEIG